MLWAFITLYACMSAGPDTTTICLYIIIITSNVQEIFGHCTLPVETITISYDSGEVLLKKKEYINRLLKTFLTVYASVIL